MPMAVACEPPLSRARARTSVPSSSHRSNRTAWTQLVADRWWGQAFVGAAGAVSQPLTVSTVAKGTSREPVQWFVYALVEGLTLMTATDDDNRAPAGGRDVVDQLRSAGALDGLFEQSWCWAGEHDWG